MTWKQHTSMWKDAVKEQEINNYSSLLYKILIGGARKLPIDIKEGVISDPMLLLNIWYRNILLGFEEGLSFTCKPNFERRNLYLDIKFKG